MARAKDHPGQVKETLVSLIIAFVMAFVFRAFVAEAFVIPTGSMAPTLLGQHTRHQSPATGLNWPVNPPEGAGGVYIANVEDPATRQRISEHAKRRAGDRILVFKYLYQIYDPKRWDVVVFKAPHEPQTNYIKRLISLPGEEPALIDGDVFIREPGPNEQPDKAINTWALPGWQIQRKPERVQRSVWQDVFWSQHQPLASLAAGFHSPWVGEGGGSGGGGAQAGWKIEGEQSYTYTGAGPTTLTWNNGILPITDYYPYNQAMGRAQFPVGDVNMALGFEPHAPRGEPTDISAVVEVRGHEFRADIRGTAVTLRMGRLGEPDALGHRVVPVDAWETLATGELPPASGKIRNLEFWHVDQSLQLWVDGELIARGEYDWTPAERVEHSTGITLDEVFAQSTASRGSALVNARAYDQPRLRWEFSGSAGSISGTAGGFTLHRVGVQRDLYYQPSYMPYTTTPGRALDPASSLVLGPDHFFVCGDNSPLSLDARLWGESDPWVREQIDPADGIVPRDLLIGRAFFVYFPALTPGGLKIPVPDFGRMRWIW